MNDPKQLWGLTENELADYAKQNRTVGKHEGIIEAENFIRKLSGLAYSEGEDKKAKNLRLLADVFKEKIAKASGDFQAAKKAHFLIWEKAFETPCVEAPEQDLSQNQ